MAGSMKPLNIVRPGRQIESEHTGHVGQLYRIMDEKRDALATARRSRHGSTPIDEQIAALRYALRALGEDV